MEFASLLKVGSRRINPNQSSRHATPLVRVAWVRYVAIVVAAIVASVMWRHSAAGDILLWAVGAAAVLNALLVATIGRSSAAGVACWVSVAVGLSAWTMLVLLSGGVASPFVAGFWLEIALCSMLIPPPKILLVVVAAAAALWSQQAILGYTSAMKSLLVETGFLFATGALTYWARRQATNREHALSAETLETTARMQRLERELEDAQKLGQMGEQVARLAHAVKSALHGLRGFAQLIEASLSPGAEQRKALDGLRLAIDHLDEIARVTLRPACDMAEVAKGTTAADLSRTLEEVIQETRPMRANVRCLGRDQQDLRGVTLSPSAMREVLLALIQNAAEASGAGSEVELTVEVAGDTLCIFVRDHGPGIAEPMLARLFEPGVTTKPTGSGFGLYLARRLVESGGGRLTAGHAEGGGALFAVHLPIQQN